MILKSKIHHLLFTVFFLFSFLGTLHSQNTIDFNLNYIDYSGAVTGNVGENISIPVQAIFYQEEGRCEGAFGPCSAFLINSLDPTIDVDFTIRELQDVQFEAFGGGNLNNDFSGNGSIGFEDLLTEFEIWPPDSSITNCEYTPVPGSNSFIASNICADDVDNITNSIGQFVVEMVATFPTECDDAPSDGINDNQAFWFLQFNLFFPEEISISSTSSNSCGFNTSCNGSNDGEITAIVSGGVPPYNYEWTDESGNIISNTQTASNLSVGFYTVTVTDDSDNFIFDSNGDGEGITCSETFEVTEPDQILISLSSFEEDISNLELDCFGDTDGSIFVDVSGGCAPYNYSWSNGLSSEDIEGLSVGSYTLIVTDSNNCSVEFTQEITEPSGIIISKNIENSIDSDGCNNLGSIDIDVSGGTPFNGSSPYLYEWSVDSDGNGSPDIVISNDEDINGLSADTYFITVTDALGCQETNVFTITWPGPFAVVIEETSNLELSCFGDCDGIINISASGGSGDYLYSWSSLSGGEVPLDQINNQNLTNLCSGEYSITITDNFFPDCTWNEQIVITEPDQELIISDIDGIINLDCFEDCDGELDITVQGGTEPYSFSWSNGETTEDINNLCSGTYTITVTDFNGCETLTSVDINQPDNPLFLTSNSIDNTCFNDCLAFIDIELSGGTPPYIYSWQGPDGFSSTDENLSNLCSGIYSLTVLDQNNCLIEDSFEILEPEELQVTIEISENNGFNISCFGGSDGTVNLTPSGGSGSYDILWSTGQTTEDLVGLTAGSYDVSITDQNNENCFIVETIILNEPSEIQVSLTSSDLTCFEICDGSISSSVLGGISEFTYEWTGPNGFVSNEQNLSNLCAGIYNLNVLDDNNCIQSSSIEIFQPEILTSNINIIPPACSGYPACVTIDSFGGTGDNYTYTFYEDAGNQGPLDNCTPEPEDILLEPSISDGCFNLVSGDYFVITTDENDCCIVNSFSISPAADVSVDINEVPDCYPNDSYLILSGWTPPLETYTVVIFDNDTDNDGLSNINSNNNPLDEDIDNIDGLNINDDDIDGDGIPNIDDYIDLDGNGVFNLGDVNTQYLFSNPPMYDFVYDQQADINCGDFLGGVWDGNGSGPGTCNEFPLVYDGGSTVVLIIAENGCFNFQVVSNDNDIYLPIGTSNEINSPSCYGETNDITFINNDIDEDGILNDNDEDIDGDGILNIDDNDINGDGCLDDGTYTNEQCETCGCSGSIQINILEDEDYVAPYTVYVSSQVYDQENNLIFESQNSDSDLFDLDDSYTWFNLGDPDDDNDGLFDYEDLFPFDFDNDGVDDCTGPIFDCDNDGILNNDDPDMDNDGLLNEDDDLFSISNLINNNFISVYDLDNGISTNDSDGNGIIDQLIINNLCVGEYIYVVQDSNGCESNPVIFQIEEVDDLVVDVNTGQEPPILCFGECNGFIDISVSGGTAPYSFLWSNGETTEDLSDLCPGFYSVTITDSNGCCEIIERTIEEVPEIEILIDSFTENLDCFGDCNGQINIDVSGGNQPYSFFWFGPDGFFSNDEDLTDLCAGTYTLEVIDSTIGLDGNGCVSSIEVEINEPEELTALFDVTGSCFNEPDGSINMTISGGSPGYDVLWSNGETSEDLNNLSTGSYTVTITDQNLCTYTNTIDINQSDQIVITELHSDFDGFGVSCNGSSDGFIDVSVSGGGGIFSYDWSNGAITEDLNNISAGIYSLIVTDQNGCTETIEVELTEPDGIDITYTSSDYNGFGVSCNGLSDGFINITVNGGTGFYNYTWTSTNGFSSNDEDISNLTAGTYFLTVSDENDCSIEIEVEITEPDELSVSVSLIQNIQCNYCEESGSVLSGNDEGRISISISGEVGDYSYDVFDNNGLVISGTTEGNTIFETSEPGEYYFVVTDFNNCNTITTETINITQPEQLCIDDVLINNSSCFSFLFNDASIELNVSGGTPPYSFDWSSNVPGPGIPNSSLIDNLSAGTYSVIITDSNNCEIISESYDITEPDPLSLSICSDAFVCCDGNNGTIVATASGGDPNYTYTLFNSSVNPPIIIGFNQVGLFNGLQSGEYLVVVTDSSWSEELSEIDPNACSISETIIINESCPVIEVVNQEDAGCSEEANLFFDISGGVLPYFIYVDGIETDTLYENSSNYLIPLTSGSHDIYITDSNIDILNACDTINNSCLSETINVNVDIIDAVYEIDEIIINQPLCPGDDGTMTILASGSQPPIGEQANFEFGVDTNNDGILSLFEVQAAYFSDYVEENEFGSNYLFTVPYISSGEYLFNSFEYFDCSESGSFTINEVNDIDFENFFVSVDAVCYNASGSAYVSLQDIEGGTPPFDVNWFLIDPDFGTLIEDPNGNGNGNSLYAGNYIVQITDGNDCSYEHNFTINQPEEELLANLEVYDPICYNNNSCSGSVTSYSTGGQGNNYTYTWFDSNNNIIISGGINSLNNLCTGDYSVEISDGVCNPIIQNFSITEPNEINVNITTELLCNGDMVVLPDNPNIPNLTVNTTINSSVEPISIYWFNNTVPNTNTPILIEDSFGNINLNTNALDIDGDGVLNVLDPDLDGDGLNNNNFIQNPNTNEDIDPLGYGNGNWWPYLSSNNLDSNISDNGYSISPVDGLYAGSYYLYIIDSNGCFSEMIYNIEEPDPLTVSWNESDIDTLIECYGANNGSIGIIIEGGTPIDDDSWPFPYYYTTWINTETTSSFSTQEISIDTLGPGTYVIEIEDANGCTTQTEEIIIAESDPLVISEVNVSDYNNFGISCFGANDGAIQVFVQGGIGPYVYNWTGPNGFNSNSSFLSNLGPGTYNLTVTSNLPQASLGDGCVQYLEIEITEPQEILISETHSDYNGFGVSCNEGTIGLENPCDGFINIDVVGGVPPYSYQWSGDSFSTNQDLSSICSGSYTLTVIDSNNCEENITIELTEPDNITFNQSIGLDVTPASCKNGNNSDGIISLNIDYIQGGVPPYSITLLETGSQVNNVSSGGSVNFENLTWDLNNDGFIDPYTVLITDSNGCQLLIESIFVSYSTGIFEVLPSPLYNIPPTCSSNNDGSLLIGSIEGGELPYQVIWSSDNGFSYSYIWSEDGISIANLNQGGTPGDIDGDGIYNYLDNNIDGDALDNDDPLEDDIDGDGISNDNDPNPYGNGTELGGVLSEDIYYLTIIDANGCESQYEYILESEQPEYNAYISDFNGFNVSCGYNDDNCENLEENAILTISEIEFDFNAGPPSLPFWPSYEAFPISIVLNGEEIGTIEGNQDLPYQISDLAPNIIGGDYILDSYEINLIDNNNCLMQSINLDLINNEGFFDVTAPEPLDVSLSIGECPECQDAENGSVEIIFSGGVGTGGGYNFYFDQNGNNDIIYANDLDGDCIPNYIPGTNYPFDIDIDGDGILNISSDIDGDGIQNFNSDIDNDGIDNGKDEDIDGDGILNINDNSPIGNNAQEIDINNDGIVDYTIVYLDNDVDGDGLPNLVDSDPFNIEDLGDISVDLSPTGNINIEGTDGSWIIDNLPYGEYLVGVSDSNGCISETLINISDEYCQYEVYDWINCLFIPSVFTPNMDGVNDFWEIYNIELYEPQILLKVYNRWGQTVFEREGEYSSTLWDGNSMNGEQLEVGTYYYVLELKEYDKKYNGHIVIKR